MKRILLCLVTVGLLVAFLVAGCAPAPAPPTPPPTPPPAPPAPPAPPPGPETIKIGGAVPLTGKLAFGGGQCKEGYEIAVEHINADGGIYVKEFDKKIPLELIVLDDATDPVKTVSLMETLNEVHKVVAYLGGAGSFLHAAAAGTAEKNKVAYIGVAFGLWDMHQRGYKYLFSPFIKSPGYAKALLDVLDHVAGTERPKVAILVRADDWGMELSDLFEKEAVKHGFQVVVNEQYSPGIKDFTPLILTAKAAGAEALVGEPIEPHGIAMLKQMKELGWDVKYIGWARAAAGPGFGEALGELSDYVVGFESWHRDVTWPGNDRLLASYQDKYGKTPAVVVGSAYACVQIVADAIERAGTLDRDKIRDAIAATDMMTVEGPIKFYPDGTSTAPAIGFQWMGGKTVLVWPLDMAKAEIAYPRP